MTAEIQTALLRPEEYESWDQLVAESPDGSIYSTTRYMSILCRVAGGGFRVLCARRGDDILGGIVLHERSSTRGRFVAPRLLCYYNSFVLRRYPTNYPSVQTARDTHTLTALGQALSAMGYARVSVRCRSTLTDARPLLSLGWACSPSYTYVVPIADLDEQWSRIEQNLRRLIKRCERQGITFTEDEDFESFDALHRDTMERINAPAYLPRDAFRLYFDLLREHDLGRLYHARLPDGRSIAAQLVLLGPSDVSHTVSAAADEEFRKSGASAFLRWKAFQALSELGYQGNDLTDASLSSVAHFKSQFGGRLECNLAFESPRTRRYRVGAAIETMYYRTRARAGTLVRSMTGRGS